MTPAQKTAKWRRDNPEKAKATRMNNYYANHEREKASRRRSGFKRLYGITPEDRDAMLEAQGFCCAACGTDDPGSKRGWCTDHCHSTLIVRGILCLRCNLALGNVQDSTDRLRNLILYLETYHVAA